MGYTLAVFGQASLNKNLIFDALADHFRFGPLDDEGYYTASEHTSIEGADLLIAVESAEGAWALEALNEWSARAGMNYTLITASGVKAKDLAKDAARIVSAPDVPERVAALLTERLEAGHEACLALAVEPGQPDESSRRLVALLGGRVATYSIGEGLLPIDPADYPPPVQAPGLAMEVGEQVEWRSAFEVDGALDLSGFLDAVEEAVSELQSATSERYHRLRQLVEELRGSLTPTAEKPRTEETDRIPQEPIEAEKVKPTKARREWLDPADGTWKPIGRGRPRKNVETREIPA